MSRDKKNGYPIDPVCPTCGRKDCVYEERVLTTRVAVNGLNCHGGALMAELTDKQRLDAEDDAADVDEQYVCDECGAHFNRHELFEASLKAGGWPNLTDTSADFRAFWKGQNKLSAPLSDEMEIMAWRCWQASRLSMAKGNK